jgi:hypothetical protein
MMAAPLQLGLIGAGIVATGPYRKALERLPTISVAGIFDPCVHKSALLAETLHAAAFDLITELSPD